VHATFRAGAERGIGQQAGYEEQEGVGREQVISDRIGLAESDHNANQADDRETDADHRGRDGEDMNAKTLLERAL
jgi:hypothetical protein